MKRLMYVSCICLFIFAVACTSQLTKIANGMQKASVAIGEVQNIIKDVYDAKLIDKPTETELLQVCIKANQLGKQIDATIKAASSVDPATKNLLVSQIAAVSAVIDPDKIAAIASIKNVNTQQKVKVGFIAVRLALTTIEATL